MKNEGRILLGLGLFFLIMFGFYWPLSHEQSGSTMMFFAVLLGFLPGGYYYWWSRRMKPRPEDSDDADMAESAGFIDSFPGSSIFPFTLGMGAWMSVMAMIFGIWLAIPALSLIVWALLGATAEARRGGHH